VFYVECAPPGLADNASKWVIPVLANLWVEGNLHPISFLVKNSLSSVVLVLSAWLLVPSTMQLHGAGKPDAAARTSLDTSVGLVHLDGGSRRISGDDEILMASIGLACRIAGNFSVRAGFQTTGQIDSFLVDPNPSIAIGGPAGSRNYLRETSRIRVASISPRFQWQITPMLTLGVSPDFNYVVDRRRLRLENPAGVPLFDGIQKTQDGGGIGGTWLCSFAVAKSLSLDATYRYFEFRPSHDRQGHAFLLGVTFR
jgi:hypothetical protein